MALMTVQSSKGMLWESVGCAALGMRRPWGGQAAKRSNLHLSAGTIDIAGTTSTRGRQQEAFTVCNTTDGLMLCCIYRLACPKTKLPRPAAPSFAASSCLVTQYSTPKPNLWLGTHLPFAWRSPYFQGHSW